MLLHMCIKFTLHTPVSSALLSGRSNFRSRIRLLRCSKPTRALSLSSEMDNCHPSFSERESKFGSKMCKILSWKILTLYARFAPEYVSQEKDPKIIYDRIPLCQNFNYDIDILFQQVVAKLDIRPESLYVVLVNIWKFVVTKIRPKTRSLWTVSAHVGCVKWPSHSPISKATYNQAINAITHLYGIYNNKIKVSVSHRDYWVA